MYLKMVALTWTLLSTLWFVCILISFWYYLTEMCPIWGIWSGYLLVFLIEKNICETKPERGSCGLRDWVCSEGRSVWTPLSVRWSGLLVCCGQLTSDSCQRPPLLFPFSVLWWKKGRNSSRGAWRPEFETALPLWFFWYWLNTSVLICNMEVRLLAPAKMLERSLC